MPLKYLKLLKQIKPIQPAPTISLGKQNVAFWVAIVSAVASIIVGTASLFLALAARDTAIKVANMDSLIKTIATQDTTLVRISNQNSTSILKLDSILKELYHQYEAATVNTEPKIKLLNPATKKLAEGFVELEVNYTNTGKRDVDELKIECFKLYDNDNHTEFDVSKSNNLNSFLTATPDEPLMFVINLGYTNPVNLNKAKYRVRFSYLDKLKNKHRFQTFYFQFLWKELTITDMLLCTSVQEKQMDKAIANFKRTGKAKQPY